MDPKEAALDADVAEWMTSCGWPVRVGQRGWACNRPALHDTEHQLIVPGGQVTARAVGYQ